MEKGGKTPPLRQFGWENLSVGVPLTALQTK
jgi:hypothetical protein